MTPEAMEKVKDIFAETLNERYAGELVFDPIIVKPDVDYYGDDYIQVWLIVNGDTNLLDPKWGAGLITQVRGKLEDEGITEFPSPYYIAEDEYRHWLKWGKFDTR
jgi:hypothetical protein